MNKNILRKKLRSYGVHGSVLMVVLGDSRWYD